MIHLLLSILLATTQTISLAKERAGHEPARFLPVVGNWIIATDDHNEKVVQVDGRQWIKGQPSAGLAEKARTIYGIAAHDAYHTGQIQLLKRLYGVG